VILSMNSNKRLESELLHYLDALKAHRVWHNRVDHRTLVAVASKLTFTIWMAA
jgi:hypothetical protein